MPYSGLAGIAIVSATILGASAAFPGLDHAEGLVGGRALDGDTIYNARITDASQRATGHIERIYLNESGQIEALKVFWRAGLMEQGFEFFQPIDRFSYNSDRNTLVADARIERMRDWARQDEIDEAANQGIPVDRVGSGVLNGSLVQTRNGQILGRVTDVIDDDQNRPAQLELISRETGPFLSRVERHLVPAHGAHWSASDRVITLPSPASA
tara:strand:+ start:10250 stop:10885 length:636 start_codon:yes stop_codon:yes gene_type:complete